MQLFSRTKNDFYKNDVDILKNHDPQLSFFLLTVNIIEAVEPDEDDEDTEEEGDQSNHK